MILTPKQQRRIEKLIDKHPGAHVDTEGTQALRATVKGAEYFVAVAAAESDQVRMWTIDAEGDVVTEHGLPYE